MPDGLILNSPVDIKYVLELASPEIPKVPLPSVEVIDPVVLKSPLLVIAPLEIVPEKTAFPVALKVNAVPSTLLIKLNPFPVTPVVADQVPA